ncbi:hypothetical protein [Oceanivirga salmonicida]|uniref:hypothetical protein n=1 Tax=Oceanivirga salmonicida TaxID=1769291 RepID=UPI0012E10A14|nr:hypothetical protein [Oceanivirga salmonicida]
MNTNKLKNLSIISMIWNIFMLILLFLQSRIFISVIKDNLLPDLKFIEKLFNNDLFGFYKYRIIVLIITIVIILIVELFVFYIVNYFIFKNLRNFTDDTDIMKIDEVKKIKSYHKNIMYVMTLFIISLILMLVIYVIKLIQLKNNIDFSVNNKTFINIIDMLKNMELKNLLDYNKVLNNIIIEIKANRDIYNIFNTIFSLHSKIIILRNIWYFVIYLCLGYGIYKNTKLLINIKK